MRKMTVALAAMAASALLVGPAAAGGGPNGTFVQFDNDGGTGEAICDSYWKTTGSGLVHEWREDTDCMFQGTAGLHLVFKPASKFSAPDCDEGSLHSITGWTNPGYGEYAGDDGDLSDFLTTGEVYHVCFYPWGEQELTS